MYFEPAHVTLASESLLLGFRRFTNPRLRTAHHLAMDATPNEAHRGEQGLR